MNSVQRHLAFDGIANFRDVGGYKTTDNQTVQWRRLYRSAHLAEASPADLTKLQDLNLRYSVDLRSNKERKREYYAYDFVQTTHLAILPKVAELARNKVMTGGGITKTEAQAFMQQMYVGFVHEQQREFSAFFKQFLAAEAPLVVHCTAGKDRTGFAVALVLLALGVHADDVMADYLLSNQFFDTARPRRLMVSDEVMKVLWSVQPDYLTAALAEIHQHHQDVPSYLQGQLGLEPLQLEKLRERMLLDG